MTVGQKPGLHHAFVSAQKHIDIFHKTTPLLKTGPLHLKNSPCLQSLHRKGAFSPAVNTEACQSLGHKGASEQAPR